MAWWAMRGYAVAASSYRGADGSQGRDKFAGNDVDDIRNLIPLARDLAGNGGAPMFALGFSRGGLMLHQIAASVTDLSAYATVGSPTELGQVVNARPDLAERLREMMPDFEEEQANGFCHRSPTCWPERIRAPLLIVHGGSDRAIDPAQAWLLAQAMEREGKLYRLVVFGGADHALNFRRANLFERVAGWFDEWRKATDDGDVRDQVMTE